MPSSIDNNPKAQFDFATASEEERLAHALAAFELSKKRDRYRQFGSLVVNDIAPAAQALHEHNATDSDLHMISLLVRRRKSMTPL